jgi:hypothetical protein
MIADVDQPAGPGKLAPLERGGDALIRGAAENDEHEDGAASQQRPAQPRRNEPHYDSDSARPYFSMRE